MEDYCGLLVVHTTKKIKGKIVAQNKDYITVVFSPSGKRMDYRYPKCFSKYLQLMDEGNLSRISPDREREESTDIKRLSNKGQVSHFDIKEQKLQKEASDKIKGRSSRMIMNDFFDNQIKLLQEEIGFVRKKGEKKTKLYDGKLVVAYGNRCIYSFDADTEMNYPDSTQISLYLPDGTEVGSGFIVNCEDYTVIIQTDKRIGKGKEVPEIEFTSSAWRLLEALIERLNNLRSNPTDIVKSLICEGKRQITLSEKMNIGQEKACHMSLFKPITFVWGPPGTGKTTTLAEIALQHINQGERVLMVSYSNVSVDGAIMKVWDKETEHSLGKLVRYGYPRDQEVLDNEYLTAYKLALKKHPDLREQRERLLEERKHLDRKSERFIDIGNQLKKIRTKLIDEEKRAVEDAMFVATTVSKAVADSLLYDGTFDTVIIDEASMAYIPHVVFAASLAQKHFVCMGDYMQLPPIVQSKEAEELNTDIFRYCGIVDAVETKRGHKWLCLLDTQRRMHPDIADFASQYMYRKLLKSAPEMTDMRKNIVASKPFSGDALRLVDLSGMMSVCLRAGESSRFNVLSAIISMGLAVSAAEKNTVGIITPYSAQSRLIHALAKDVMEKHKDLKPIACKTVHQFQGSEEDIIIYDAVDCYVQERPGVMLTSTKNDYANRLFNVALTRAKGKMISIVNVDYMEKKRKDVNQKLMFRVLMDSLRDNNRSSNGEEIFSEFGRGEIKIYNNAETGRNAFLNDVAKTKHVIRIDIPGGTSGDKNFFARMSKELHALHWKNISICLRVQDLEAIPEKIRRFSVEDKNAWNPLVFIDESIVWFGMPPSDAVFMPEGKEKKTDYRPIIRIESRHFVQTLYGFLEIEKKAEKAEKLIRKKLKYTSFVKYAEGEIGCTKCGKKVKYKKYPNGKAFLECSSPSCIYHKAIGKEEIEEYLVFCAKSGKKCPTCNSALEILEGEKGFRIGCNGNPKHCFDLDMI